MAKSGRIKRLLHRTKRGLSSLFVCSVIIIPILTLASIPKDFIHLDKRKAGSLPPLSVRSVDDTTKPLTPFKEPVISVTFDDGWESIYTVAMPILLKNGIRSTQYLLSGTADDQAYVSRAQIQKMHEAKQEIACHTVDHADLTTIDSQAVQNELVDCQRYFSKDYGQIQDFATPYGSYNNGVLAQIKQVYRSHRNTNGDITNGINEADINLPLFFDTNNIIGVTIRHDTTIEQLKAAINYTVAHNGWLVITYHQIEDNATKFALDPQLLDQQITYISKSPVRIVPVGEFLNAWEASK